MSFKTLSAVLRGGWLIDKQWAEQHIGLVVSLLEGKPVDFGSRNNVAYDDGGYSRPKAGTDESEDYYVRAIVPVGSSVKVGRYTSFDQVPAGSVAVIPVTGPILKYGGDCGEPGSVHMASWVKAAEASPNISSIVCIIDSPGGQVDGTATLADVIKSCSKPVIGFVDDGMMASAAMWIGSACDELYASRATDGVGSIGVLCSIADFRGYLEKNGIKLHEIYAPQSTEKNQDYKKALEGDYSLVEADLKRLASEFISTIKTNRKGKLNLEEADPFKGAMFFADQAVKIGLIDGIKSLDEVFAIASNYKSDNKISHTNSQNTMFGKKFSKLADLKGKESITAEEITAVNAELEEAGITSVAVISEAQHTVFENAVAQVASLTTEKQTLTDANATLTTAATAKDTRIAELEAEVKKLGGEAGGKHTNLNSEGDTTHEGADKGFKLNLSAEDKKAINAVV